MASSPLTEAEERALQRDADGEMKFDGFVRMPCTGPGCDVIAYVSVGTEPEAVLCHACGMVKRKEADMAAKKAKKGSRTTKAREHVNGDAVERQHFHERLPVKIGASEVERASAELAKLIRERKNTLERKREVNADFRSKISFYDERLEELGETVEGSIEMRSVECVERFIARTNSVDVVRMDTGEIVRSRAATAEDRQEDLDLEDGADKDEGGDEASV